jgi:hypothetical protein
MPRARHVTPDASPRLRGGPGLVLLLLLLLLLVLVVGAGASRCGRCCWCGRGAGAVAGASRGGRGCWRGGGCTSLLVSAQAHDRSARPPSSLPLGVGASARPQHKAALLVPSWCRRKRTTAAQGRPLSRTDCTHTRGTSCRTRVRADYSPSHRRRSLPPSPRRWGRKDHPFRGRADAMCGHGHLCTAGSHSLPFFSFRAP